MVRLFSIAILFISFTGLAQNTDTATSHSPRRAYHYIGIQSNQLFRQILNLSNTNTAIDNPYTLVYAVNNVTTGFGVNASIGVNINNATSGDATLKRESDINDIFLRFGFEKKSMLSKKWMTSWGFDILVDNSNNKTVATSDFGNSNKSSITTENTVNAQGIGPRFTLSYKISDKIFIGTDASYYYKAGKVSSTVNNSTTSFQFNPNTQQNEVMTTNNKTESSSKTAKFQLAVPIALYLIVKL